MSLSVTEMPLLRWLLDEALPLDRAERKRWLENLAPEHAELAGQVRDALLAGGDVTTGAGRSATLASTRGRLNSLRRPL